MTAVVVIVEVPLVQTVELSQHRKQSGIQNSAEGVCVDLSVIWNQGSQTKPGKTSPEHNCTSAKRNCIKNALWYYIFLRQTLDPDPIILTVENKP